MTDDKLSIFGDLLREYRENAGLTQEELAERADLSVRTVSDIERGITLKSHAYTIRRLCKALKLGPSEQAKLRTSAQAASAKGTATSASAISIPARLLVITALTGTALLLILAVIAYSSNTKQTTPTPTQKSSALQVVGGRAGLQFGPISKTSDGLLYVEVGQSVKVEYDIRNTDPTASQVGKLWGLTASVRGPDACTLGWNAPNQDFPPALKEGIVLQPGEEYQYSQTRSFDVPGVYFVEPTKLGADGKWGGVPPFPRIYFMVVDADAARVLATGTAGKGNTDPILAGKPNAATACITPEPVPSRP